MKGGYNIPYDVSKPLRRLQSIGGPEEMQVIFDELWENLHHQGHVGLASYLAVPQLVEICIQKRSLDYNFIGLSVAIEIVAWTARTLSFRENTRKFTLAH